MYVLRTNEVTIFLSCHKGLGIPFLIFGFDFGRSLWRKEPARERSLSAARNPPFGELYVHMIWISKGRERRGVLDGETNRRSAIVEVALVPPLRQI